jgi:hypothetical protein
MAKYHVTYRCRCEKVLELFGPEKERKRKLAAVPDEDCLECKTRKQAIPARAWATERGLPLLVGSTEHGRNWAEVIRQQDIQEVERAFRQADEAERRSMSPEQYEATRAPLKRAWYLLGYAEAEHTSASWWIEQRGTLLSDIRRQLREEFGKKEKNV